MYWLRLTFSLLLCWILLFCLSKGQFIHNPSSDAFDWLTSDRQKNETYFVLICKLSDFSLGGEPQGFILVGELVLTYPSVQLSLYLIDMFHSSFVKCRMSILFGGCLKYIFTYHHTYQCMVLDILIFHLIVSIQDVCSVILMGCVRGLCRLEVADRYENEDVVYLMK